MSDGFRKLCAQFRRPNLAPEANGSPMQLRTVNLSRVSLTTAVCVALLVVVFIHYGAIVAAYGAILLSSIVSVFSGGCRRPADPEDYHSVVRRAFALLGTLLAVLAASDICIVVLIWVFSASTMLEFITSILFDINRLLGMTWMWEGGSPKEYYQSMGRLDLYNTLIAMKAALRISDSVGLLLTAGLYHYITITHGESLVPLFIYSRKHDLNIKYVIAGVTTTTASLFIIYGLYAFQTSEIGPTHYSNTTHRLFLVNVVGSCIQEGLTIFFLAGLALLAPGRHWARL